VSSIDPLPPGTIPRWLEGDASACRSQSQGSDSCATTAKSVPQSSCFAQRERQIAHLAVGQDVFPRHWFSIHYHFNRHFPRIANARTLNMPVRSPRVRPITNEATRSEKWVIRRRPLRGRLGGNVEVQNAAAVKGQNQEDVKNLEADRVMARNVVRKTSISEKL